MTCFRVFIFCALIFLSTPAHADEVNAGFVQGLWYASPVVIADEPTRIYVALRNHTDQDLTGTVRFTDNGKRIGVSYVSALPGRLVEAWVDWTPSAGEHVIAASLSEIRLHTIGESPETAEVVSMLAEDKITVDYDTDKDGVVNGDDTDDDNDGISDTDEIERGTNPLVANPKPQEKNEKEEREDSEDEDENTRSERTSTTEDADTESGLEKYLDEGRADSLLTNVTEKVEGAKQSLDTYRDARNEKMSGTSTLPGSTISGDTATITRSKIDSGDSFLKSFVSGVGSLLHNGYTFILWTLSAILGHPALIQFVLLIGILYIFYRIARRLGRRPS